MSDSTDLEVIEAGSEVEHTSHAFPQERVDELPIPVDIEHHPGPRQYVLIAVVLVVITAVEVAASYLDGDMNSNLLIGLLAVMAAVKFFLVCSWYMHMKQDAPFFRRTFLVGLVGATIVYSIVLLTFASTVLKS
jgi:caa(3)-type oxidase subunit IV